MARRYWSAVRPACGSARQLRSAAFFTHCERQRARAPRGSDGISAKYRVARRVEVRSGSGNPASNRPKDHASTASRAGYPPASVRFDWAMGFLALLLIGGVIQDGWAHAHRLVDQTFLTPWHAMLYSMVGLSGIILGTFALRNCLAGYPAARALALRLLPCASRRRALRSRGRSRSLVAHAIRHRDRRGRPDQPVASCVGGLRDARLFRADPIDRAPVRSRRGRLAQARADDLRAPRLPDGAGLLYRVRATDRRRLHGENNSARPERGGRRITIKGDGSVTGSSIRHWNTVASGSHSPKRPT